MEEKLEKLVRESVSVKGFGLHLFGTLHKTTVPGLYKLQLSDGYSYSQVSSYEISKIHGSMIYLSK